MATNATTAAGRKPKVGKRQSQRTIFPDGEKFTMKLNPEEVALCRALARVIAQPGQTLSRQDVLRICLANIGLQRRKDLSKGSDL